MCAPAVVPIITAVAGAATVAQQLGIIGGGNRRQQQASQQQQRQLTAPPPMRSPGPAAARGLDPEEVRAEEESVKVKQNAKQKRDKHTVKKGLLGLGAAPAVNLATPVNTPPEGVNLG